MTMMMMMMETSYKSRGRRPGGVLAGVLNVGDQDGDEDEENNKAAAAAAAAAAVVSSTRTPEITRRNTTRTSTTANTTTTRRKQQSSSQQPPLQRRPPQPGAVRSREGGGGGGQRQITKSKIVERYLAAIESAATVANAAVVAANTTTTSTTSATATTNYYDDEDDVVVLNNNSTRGLAPDDDDHDDDEEGAKYYFSSARPPQQHHQHQHQQQQFRRESEEEEKMNTTRQPRRITRPQQQQPAERKQPRQSQQNHQRRGAAGQPQQQQPQQQPQQQQRQKPQPQQQPQQRGGGGSGDHHTAVTTACVGDRRRRRHQTDAAAATAVHDDDDDEGAKEEYHPDVDDDDENDVGAGGRDYEYDNDSDGEHQQQHQHNKKTAKAETTKGRSNGFARRSLLTTTTTTTAASAPTPGEDNNRGRQRRRRLQLQQHVQTTPTTGVTAMTDTTTSTSGASTTPSPAGGGGGVVRGRGEGREEEDGGGAHHHHHSPWLQDHNNRFNHKRKFVSPAVVRPQQQEQDARRRHHQQQQQRQPQQAGQQQQQPQQGGQQQQQRYYRPRDGFFPMTSPNTKSSGVGVGVGNSTSSSSSYSSEDHHCTHPTTKEINNSKHRDQNSFIEQQQAAPIRSKTITTTTTTTNDNDGILGAGRRRIRRRNSHGSWTSIVVTTPDPDNSNSSSSTLSSPSSSSSSQPMSSSSSWRQNQWRRRRRIIVNQQQRQKQQRTDVASGISSGVGQRSGAGRGGGGVERANVRDGGGSGSVGRQRGGQRGDSRISVVSNNNKNINKPINKNGISVVVDQGIQMLLGGACSSHVNTVTTSPSPQPLQQQSAAAMAGQQQRQGRMLSSFSTYGRGRQKQQQQQPQPIQRAGSSSLLSQTTTATMITTPTSNNNTYQAQVMIAGPAAGNHVVDCSDAKLDNVAESKSDFMSTATTNIATNRALDLAMRKIREIEGDKKKMKESSPVVTAAPAVKYHHPHERQRQPLSSSSPSPAHPASSFNAAAVVIDGETAVDDDTKAENKGKTTTATSKRRQNDFAVGNSNGIIGGSSGGVFRDVGGGSIVNVNVNSNSSNSVNSNSKPPPYVKKTMRHHQQQPPVVQYCFGSTLLSPGPMEARSILSMSSNEESSSRLSTATSPQQYPTINNSRKKVVASSATAASMLLKSRQQHSEEKKDMTIDDSVLGPGSADNEEVEDDDDDDNDDDVEVVSIQSQSINSIDVDIDGVKATTTRRNAARGDGASRFPLLRAVFSPTSRKTSLSSIAPTVPVVPEGEADDDDDDGDHYVKEKEAEPDAIMNSRRDRSNDGRNLLVRDLMPSRLQQNVDDDDSDDEIDGSKITQRATKQFETKTYRISPSQQQGQHQQKQQKQLQKQPPQPQPAISSSSTPSENDTSSCVSPPPIVRQRQPIVVLEPSPDPIFCSEQTPPEVMHLEQESTSFGHQSGTSSSNTTMLMMMTNNHDTNIKLSQTTMKTAPAVTERSKVYVRPVNRLSRMWPPPSSSSSSTTIGYNSGAKGEASSSDCPNDAVATATATESSSLFSKGLEEGRETTFASGTRAGVDVVLPAKRRTPSAKAVSKNQRPFQHDDNDGSISTKTTIAERGRQQQGAAVVLRRNGHLSRNDTQTMNVKDLGYLRNRAADRVAAQQDPPLSSVANLAQQGQRNGVSTVRQRTVADLKTMAVEAETDLPLSRANPRSKLLSSTGYLLETPRMERDDVSTAVHVRPSPASTGDDQKRKGSHASEESVSTGDPMLSTFGIAYHHQQGSSAASLFSEVESDDLSVQAHLDGLDNRRKGSGAKKAPAGRTRTPDYTARAAAAAAASAAVAKPRFHPGQSSYAGSLRINPLAVEHTTREKAPRDSREPSSSAGKPAAKSATPASGEVSLNPTGRASSKADVAPITSSRSLRVPHEGSVRKELGTRSKGADQPERHETPPRTLLQKFGSVKAFQDAVSKPPVSTKSMGSPEEKTTLGKNNRKPVLRKSPQSPMEESLIDTRSVDIQSVLSAFESLQASIENKGDSEDDDSASVKSLRELFEGATDKPPADNAVSRRRAMFEVQMRHNSNRFRTGDSSLREAFAKFEAKPSAAVTKRKRALTASSRGAKQSQRRSTGARNRDIKEHREEKESIEVPQSDGSSSQDGFRLVPAEEDDEKETRRVAASNFRERVRLFSLSKRLVAGSRKSAEHGWKSTEQPPFDRCGDMANEELEEALLKPIGALPHQGDTILKPVPIKPTAARSGGPAGQRAMMGKPSAMRPITPNSSRSRGIRLPMLSVHEDGTLRGENGMTQLRGVPSSGSSSDVSPHENACDVNRRSEERTAAPSDENYSRSQTTPCLKASSSELSDGLTLEVSVAEVSGLTNPTALLSKADNSGLSLNEMSSAGPSSKSTDMIESDAKRSEASSSQPSEAATPLIAKAMGLLMSDDQSAESFFSRRAILNKAIRWKDNAHAEENTPVLDGKEEVKNVDDNNWDIQHVKSSFPTTVASPHGVDIFEVETEWKSLSDTTNSRPSDAAALFLSNRAASGPSSRSTTPTRRNTSGHFFLRAQARFQAALAERGSLSAPSSNPLGMENRNGPSAGLTPLRTHAHDTASVSPPPVPQATTASTIAPHFRQKLPVFQEEKTQSRIGVNSITGENEGIRRYSLQHESLLARLRALKESRLRRAAANASSIHNNPNSLDYGGDAMLAKDDDFSNSTKSSTRFGGTSFFAALEVE